MTRSTSIALAIAVLSLSGCSGGMEQLQQQVAEIKARPGEPIEPLPEIKPYEAFTYNAANMRSPFVPMAPARGDVANAVRPDVKRPREFLEQFSLDTLRMVGTLRMADRTYGLVKTKDGLVHRVLPGNYMGQADGRVIEISPSKISVVEIVPDGLGGYIERPASLALNN